MFLDFWVDSVVLFYRLRQFVLFAWRILFPVLSFFWYIKFVPHSGQFFLDLVLFRLSAVCIRLQLFHNVDVLQCNVFYFSRGCLLAY